MRAAIPRLLALCSLVGASAPQAKADAIADFYKGRTVTVVVSSSAGGGYDTLARALARYMGRHMPSHPVFVVRNMPGAGGMTATNFLYNNADKDGSVIGLVQNNTPFEPLFGTKEARYDPVRFNWLGSPSAETAMVLLWHAAPVNSVAELKAREVAVGVSGANSTPAFFTRLLNATLGTENEAHQWLSRSERCAPRHGTARDSTAIPARFSARCARRVPPGSATRPQRPSCSMARRNSPSFPMCRLLPISWDMTGIGW
jgi:Uncharacterized protein conserved in bacteria